MNKVEFVHWMKSVNPALLSTQKLEEVWEEIGEAYKETMPIDEPGDEPVEHSGIYTTGYGQNTHAPSGN